MIQNLELDDGDIQYVDEINEDGADLEFTVYNDMTGNLVEHRFF